MKILFVLAILAALPVGYLSHDWISQNSRYELLRGVEPYWQAEPEEATFRIDRKTGQVWKLNAEPVQVDSTTVTRQRWARVMESEDRER